MKLTLDRTAPIVTQYVKAGVPCNLIGPPGVGKSDVIKQVAQALDLKIIDFRLSTADPTDLSGLPFIDNGRSVFLPNEAFPIATDKLPRKLDKDGQPVTRKVLNEDGTPKLNGSGEEITEEVYYKGWLLFLDEITNAPMAVQAAAYKLILDREVGLHKLHDDVHIVSAGNTIKDGAAVTGEMSTALKSRMAHINIEVNLDAWLDWAMKAGVSHEITSFIKFMPKYLWMFDAKNDADTFPCPRTWGMVDRVLKLVGIGDKNLQNLVSGIIADGPAVEFINYSKNFANLPTYADIIKNPKSAPMPEEMSTLYALSGSIGAQTKADSVDKVMEYLERMPKEFQLRTFNDFTKRDPKLVSVQEVRNWLMSNAKHLLGN